MRRRTMMRTTSSTGSRRKNVLHLIFDETEQLHLKMSWLVDIICNYLHRYPVSRKGSWALARCSLLVTLTSLSVYLPITVGRRTFLFSLHHLLPTSSDRTIEIQSSDRHILDTTITTLSQPLPQILNIFHHHTLTHHQPTSTPTPWRSHTPSSLSPLSSPWQWLHHPHQTHAIPAAPSSTTAKAMYVKKNSSRWEFQRHLRMFCI